MFAQLHAKDIKKKKKKIFQHIQASVYRMYLAQPFQILLP